MKSSMSALVYEAPLQMHIRQVPVPALQPYEVLVRTASYEKLLHGAPISKILLAPSE